MKKNILAITIPVLFAVASLAALLWFFFYNN